MGGIRPNLEQQNRKRGTADNCRLLSMADKIPCCMYLTIQQCPAGPNPDVPESFQSNTPQAGTLLGANQQL